VNAAREVYFEGHFDAAEEYLIRAMNRRRRSNLEEDPEISYWLTIVRGAVTLRAGRVILPTAPLYAEMSQLLSEARKNYNEGIALINGERREEGFARFAESRRKTAEVRLMFPVNQEASLLDLRMDQVIDPAAFNASFQRRLNQAVSGVAQGSVESFAELQNLSQINPGYPGIRGMVVQAEIDLGYRPAPPDPRSLARSGELAATARGIIERNLRSQFPVALEMLNQALILNHSNDQAMSLKDRLQTELGGGGSAVLHSAAEREYQRAVQALQQGNTLVAMTIVRHLLSDAQNQTSRRVLDLQKRIESIL
jgi:tetratricopeptide (TPR) repeat protein